MGRRGFTLKKNTQHTTLRGGWPGRRPDYCCATVEAGTGEAVAESGVAAAALAAALAAACCPPGMGMRALFEAGGSLVVQRRQILLVRSCLQGT